MLCFPSRWAATVAFLGLCATRAPAQCSGVLVLDPTLEYRIENLERASPSFGREMALLRDSGFTVIVGNRKQIEHRLPEAVASPPLPGYTRWFTKGDTLASAMVMIDVMSIRRMRNGAISSNRAVQDAIDEALVHEMYGHVMAAAPSRSVRDLCRDPTEAGEKAAQASCALQRENRVRSELGLAVKNHYFPRRARR